jgi:hypothetical protein
MRATYIAHTLRLDLTPWSMEQYKLWSASSRKSVQPLALDILKYKYCPEHPSICVIPSTWETKFYTDTKNIQNYNVLYFSLNEFKQHTGR